MPRWAESCIGQDSVRARRRVSWNGLICGTLRGRPRIRWRVNVYEEVGAFYEGYRGEKRIIGASREGRNLYAMYVGTAEGVRGGTAAGIATYAIHAREWITSYLALQHLRRGIVRGGVWVVPLVNPDGALLVQEGADSVRPSLRGGLLYLNGGADFSLWKANARAVDLNVNFDAGWGTGRQNVSAPAPANYIGTAPFSEPETQALRDFTLEVTPSFTVSYHTKGEVIYWRYRQSALRAARDKKYAKILSRATGYPLAEAADSAGGYKDWCVEHLRIPAFTVEAGRESFVHPLGLSSLADIVTKNIDALAALSMGFS